MKLKLDGSFDVAAAPADVFGFLTDPTRFAPLLPMFKELRDVEAGRFKVLLEVGVPQIRGLVEATVTMVENAPPNQATYRSSTRHALGMADSDIGFQLSPLGTGTRVEWRSETLVRGTLASIANGILMPLAKRNVEAMINALRAALSESPQSAPAAPVEPVAAAAGAPSWWERLLAAFGFGKGNAR